MDEEILVLACADGAGSADFSQIGATLACERFVALACDQLQATVSMVAMDEAVLLRWFRDIHETLSQEAQRREIAPRQLACTLLVAIVGEHQAVFAQIGDGAIVIRQDDAYRVVFWPQSGEYVNTTHFVTDAGFQDAFQYAHRARVDELSLLTDGLQMLALHFGAKEVHRPFFAPMFELLRQSTAHEELIVPFRQFLDSPGVNARTDDDKTLILATRLHSHAPSATR